jgi:GAF domain-containing protein
MQEIMSQLESAYPPRKAGDGWHFRDPRSPREEAERTRSLLDLASTLTGWGGAPSRFLPLDLTTAEDALAGAHDAVAACLRASGPQVANEATRGELVALLARLGQARIALRESVLAHRAATMNHIRGALGRLREAATVPEMAERAPREAYALGFDRGLFSRIKDSHWVTETCFVDRDPEFAAVIVGVGRSDPALLDDRLLETEMVRTGRPLLVNDPEHNGRVHHSLRRATETRAYVAAPVRCGTETIGFLHADGFREQRRMDTFDRDTLAMFAEGLGCAMERMKLTQQLAAMRGHVEEYSGLVTDLIEQFVESDIRRQERNEDLDLF